MNKCWKIHLRLYRNGEVVDGTVIDVKPDEIILNIGYKADGIITRGEYTKRAECRFNYTCVRW